MSKGRAMVLISSHSQGLSQHTEFLWTWANAMKAVFEWGVYCERLRVTPDKPRIRLYHG